MPETIPSPRKRRRWLRWTLIVFAMLGLAIFLLFRDVALEPADDLMLKRPVIAWDDNNGWKKLLELGERLPAPDKEAMNLVSQAIEMKVDTSKDLVRGMVLTDADISELESVARMPQWQNRIRSDLTDSKDRSVEILSSVWYRFKANSLLAIEEGSFPTLLRNLQLGVALQQKYVAAGTSLIDILAGFSWLRDELVARALVRLDLEDAELAGLDQLLAGDPFDAEDYREALRYEFRERWNFMLKEGSAPGAGGKGLRQYYFQKNRTLNLLARESRAALNLAITAPSAAIDELSRERKERWKRLSMWRSPNMVGEIILGSMAVDGSMMEFMMRTRIAVRRGLRVVVALHRYHKAHGSLPATLDALVPAFLPAVPQDPFDFKPLRWDAVKRAVYSIGSDTKDQPPNFEDGTSQSGWWMLATTDFKSPGVRYRTKADGPDFPPGTTLPVKPGPKAKPAPAKP